MASIAKRSDGRWRARYRDSAGHEHSRHFRRRVDAQSWINGVTSAVVTGSYVDPAASRVTFGAWAGGWLEDQAHLKESTRVRYGGLLRTHILPRWGSVPLSEIRHAEVATWVAGLTATGRAPSTVRQAHRVLALVLSLAVRDGRLARNPSDGVRLPPAATRVQRFLTHADLARLANAAGADGLVIRTLGLCGLRYGELAALRVSRLDLVRRRINVTEAVTEVNGAAIWGTPKTHHRRSVPVPRSLAEDIASHVDGRGPNDLVFTAPKKWPLGPARVAATSIRPSGRSDRSGRADTARPKTYGRVPCHQRRCQRQRGCSGTPAQR